MQTLYTNHLKAPHCHKYNDSASMAPTWTHVG